MITEEALQEKAKWFQELVQDNKESLHRYVKLSDALEIFNQQREKEWISVNDELPKHAVKVIVQHETSNGKDHAFGVYHEDVKAWFYFSGSYKIENSIEVTHWQHDLPIV